MGVLEANAILEEIRREDLFTIFQLWLEAGNVEHDIAKQGSIATVMGAAMREQGLTPKFAEQIRSFIVNPGNLKKERNDLIGALTTAATRESIEVLLQLEATVTDEQLRRAIIQGISLSGTLWGDGKYHEERSPPLEKAWRESQDSDLLIFGGKAIAQIGAPSGIKLLLSAALSTDPQDRVRRRAAQSALRDVYTHNAVPPVAELLSQQSTVNDATELAGNILVKIGDEAASGALIGWLQTVGADAAPWARTLVLKTNKPALLDAWQFALDQNVPFRDERVREAIRSGLEEYRRSRRLIPPGQPVPAGQ